MTTRAEKITSFRAAHVPGRPLLLPNPWDAGSARLLASMGFRALATTSSGHAGTLGRRDGAVGRAEALRHAAELVEAVDLPVSADLENGYARDPEAVRSVVSDAAAVGLAGCSIEDFTGEPGAPIYDAELAAERIAAAADAAHATDPAIVLTARAENFLHGNPDLDDTIARLVSYRRAGADVVYAPGLRDVADVRAVVDAVGVPVNALLTSKLSDVAALAGAGVARVSVGGAFHGAALAALHRAGREFLGGTSGFLDAAADGRSLADQAFRGA